LIFILVFFSCFHTFFSSFFFPSFSCSCSHLFTCISPLGRSFVTDPLLLSYCVRPTRMRIRKELMLKG
jgi:hypothetical protein